MIFQGDKVRLTRHELAIRRAGAARNGHVVNDITTRDALLEATLAALRPELQADMLEFFETGSSPLTRQGKDRR